MQTMVYGLSTCDTTKASLRWYKQHQQEVSFHDFKTGGISSAKIKSWLQQVPLEKLLNKKSTTWRGLEAAEQAMANDEKTAISLLEKYPTLIKRPVIENNGKLAFVGLVPSGQK